MKIVGSKAKRQRAMCATASIMTRATIELVRVGKYFRLTGILNTD